MSEMSEQKKRDEITKILALIYYEWGKSIDQELITYWCGNLRGMSKDFVWKVARELIRRKTYGEPKFQDFWNLAKELSGRKLIGPHYNPWALPESRQYLLTDLPGYVVEDAETGETEIFQLPQPRDGRREVTADERKWIEYTGKKAMQ